MVQRAVAVVYARVKRVVAANAESGEGNIGSGDSELAKSVSLSAWLAPLWTTCLFASSPKPLDDRPAKLEWKRRLRTVGAGDWIARSVWSTHAETMLC